MVRILPMPEAEKCIPCHRVESLDEQTMYRKWTVVKGTIPQVPGLTDVFRDAGLTCTSKAEQWCESTGAAFLEEVLEEFDAICEFLELDKASRFGFFIALHKHAQGRSAALSRNASARVG
uniref:Uncharacterized protein n=1 Tax=Noctiluca scintillans TaxID=2966 RepID=A0A7S1AH55_NOCSC|mmetsp:Transcript_4610/g.12905  ORF Transcript_4610/g.12905 Transcript_4610/m.12905 type:complete len:120 (+) Transcript_4610:90-449(+)|eukprot:CAMPEP_0194485444 /NCGR_PEP_ID=MMETSP0253-20130528/6456_1 /TAXON_ID=2966 /ORGANISM="Noctiluca scintillans" /LENGTH=119 /DNA_ID=CAMNT_0039325433 /DNA_START=59 /DNA_END=418 /DNA_ORIENTATION=+